MDGTRKEAVEAYTSENSPRRPAIRYKMPQLTKTDLKGLKRERKKIERREANKDKPKRKKERDKGSMSRR
jgi:hypothetical protein